MEIRMKHHKVVPALWRRILPSDQADLFCSRLFTLAWRILKADCHAATRPKTENDKMILLMQWSKNNGGVSFVRGENLDICESLRRIQPLSLLISGFWYRRKCWTHFYKWHDTFVRVEMQSNQLVMLWYFCFEHEVSNLSEVSSTVRTWLFKHAISQDAQQISYSSMHTHGSRSACCGCLFMLMASVSLS